MMDIWITEQRWFYDFIVYFRFPSFYSPIIGLKKEKGQRIARRSAEDPFETISKKENNSFMICLRKCLNMFWNIVVYVE